ncbi:hypothetical protein Fcan01_22511 [Folsomia candida]|uniref:Uncharacterized protein n=1 Tax=Folsomia candida TaxID=158441 RepID=A0A226DB90_FOLCA|nr:hypothetical protein Fcan01_22511 [Folsomia candida]
MGERGEGRVVVMKVAVTESIRVEELEWKVGRPRFSWATERHQLSAVATFPTNLGSQSHLRGVKGEKYEKGSNNLVVVKPLSSGLDVGGERQLCFPFSCITANHLALCLGGAHPLFYRSPDTFILGPRLGEVNVNKDKNSGGESNPKEKMTQQPPFSSYLILMTMANSVCVRERRKHSQRDPSPFFVRVAAGSKSAAYCPGTCIREDDDDHHTQVSTQCFQYVSLCREDNGTILAYYSHSGPAATPESGDTSYLFLSKTRSQYQISLPLHWEDPGCHRLAQSLPLKKEDGLLLPPSRKSLFKGLQSVRKEKE